MHDDRRYDEDCWSRYPTLSRKLFKLSSAYLETDVAEDNQRLCCNYLTGVLCVYYRLEGAQRRTRGTG